MIAPAPAERAPGSDQGSPAGLLRRLAACTYDLLLLIALWMLVSALFLPFNDGNAPVPGTALFNALRLSLLLTGIFFFAGFWKYGGQTLGMRAWRIRLERMDGRPLAWQDCLLRLAAAIFSLLPFGAGFLWALFDRDKLTWHDRLSRTRLLRVT